VWEASAAWFSMLSIAITAERLETLLAGGSLACPDCSGRLSPWGFARPRGVRMLHGTRSLRPRRACCDACRATHVLCPSWSVPRRRDGAEVIGEGLRLAAAGVGHRRIAARLGRAPGTVRGWLRAGRSRAENLRACATRQLASLDPEPAAVTAADSSLGDAVEAIMLAVRALVLRLGLHGVSPWELAVYLTGGLLHGRLPPAR
jgi:hypothetical protein